MAQEFRPLVITNGVQKRLPDNDALEIGPGGLVAQNDGAVVKMSIGHADNLLLEDGANPASNHIEFLGSTKFNKDVLIQGELRVVGDSFAVDTMVTETIFEQSVVFGNETTDSVQVVGIADFDGSIDADVSKLSAYSSGGIMLHTGATADTALEPQGSGIHIEADDFVDVVAGNAGSFKATAGNLVFDAEQGLLDLDGLTVHMQSDGILDIASVGNMSLASQGTLAESATGAHTLSAQSSTETITAQKKIVSTTFWIEGEDESRMFTTGGADLIVNADGLLDLDGATVNMDSTGLMHLGAGANAEWLVTGNLNLEATGTLTGKAVAGPINLLSGPLQASPVTLAPGELAAGSDEKMTFRSGADMELDANEQLVGSSKTQFIEFYARAAEDAALSWNAHRIQGNVLLDADKDLRAKADESVAIQAGSSGSFEALNGTLVISGKKTGGTAVTPSFALSPADLFASSENNVQVAAQNNMYMKTDVGLMDLFAKTSFKAAAEAALDLDAGAALTAKAAGLMKLDADVSLEADIEGGLTITVDSDGAGNAGNVLLDANYDVAKTQGGNVSIHAGNDDKGYFRVAAGERVAGTWAAPNDGEIELRAQMDMRLRAAGDLRMEVGSTKDVILDDSSAGVFDEANEIGHARIRNVKDPTHAQDVVTKKYMEENGGGTVKLLAHEALAKGDLVALNVSGKVEKASAAPNAGDYVFGIATHAAAQADDEILVRMLGKFNTGIAVGANAGELNFAATDIGKPLYLDASASGGLTLSAPQSEGEMVQRVGFYLGQDSVDSKAVVLMMIGEPVIL
jgi:hypothetical protein